MHLVGDLHQPVHTTALVDDAHPKGDHDGGLDFVRAKGGNTPIKLNSFWDCVVLGSERPTSVRARATTLWSGAASPAEPEVIDLQALADAFEQWARTESYPLALRDA
jgi:hypothetical protein